MNVNWDDAEQIVRTVVYSDAFDYPLTPAEIHRYLVGRPLSPQAVAGALDHGPLLPARLSRRDGTYMLPGREALADVRRRRAAVSARLWPAAVHYGRLIARLPFVRLVAVTGSLAVNNVAHEDIDYLIITANDRLWVSRAFVLLVVRLAARRGVALCPNFFLSERALSLRDRNLYTAHEIAQMVPLHGLPVYDALRRANAWTSRFLPNAVGAPDWQRDAANESWIHLPRPSPLLESLLSGSLGRRLERWEMERKMSKFERLYGPSPESEFNADTCKGHFNLHQRRAIAAYEQRVGEEESNTEEEMSSISSSVSFDTLRETPRPSSVLLGQSYFLRFDPKLWAAQQPYPPLGTLYAAAVLRQHDYPVALFDAMLAESEDEWAAALDAHRPRFAVLYEDNFNYLSKMCLGRMRQAAFTQIHQAIARGCTVIVCGADATDHSADYLAAGAHYVLLGEGEATLIELLDRLTGRTTTPLSDIPGLAWCDDGRPRHNPRRPPLADLDALPDPAWDLVDVGRYRRVWQEHHGYYSMNMATTRGCPYHCNWCAKPIWGQRYHSRSPEHVAAEMGRLKATYAPDHIWFADDIMGLKPGWWSRFADEVSRLDAHLPFKCLSRADLLARNEADVAALARAGADIVWIGAESGSQAILDAMEKGTTVEQIRTAAASLRRAGVRVGFFLQFGYPGETRADIEATLQLVRDCRPDDIGMSVSYPLPGTKFHRAVRDQLSNKQNWDDSADLDMLYAGPFSTAFYRQLHDVLHREFRARRALAQGPRLLHPRHWREGAAAVYRLATLPIARRRLDRLADPGPTFRPPIAMSPAAAARPSPQREEPQITQISQIKDNL